MKQDPVRNQGLGGILGALALGAAAMYFADPNHGRRRRAWAQDQLRHMINEGSGALQATMRDLGNRLEGVQARIGEHGHAHEHGSDFHSHEGAEVERHLEQVTQSLLPGWSADKLARFGSIALAAASILRRHPATALVALAGLGWWARGGRLGGVPDFGKVLRLGGGPDNGLDLQKTIEIKASPETVYDIWRNYDNFPHFMSHVLDVRDLGQQRSHWVVKGPMGEKVEWDAVLIDALRPRVLAWRSEPGATVEHQGRVVFEPTDKGTRVTVRMRYTPPAGMLGHGVAVLLGSDPKQTMDDDLLRMKNFIERGVRPHDAGEGKTSAGYLLH